MRTVWSAMRPNEFEMGDEDEKGKATARTKDLTRKPETDVKNHKDVVRKKLIQHRTNKIQGNRGLRTKKKTGGRPAPPTYHKILDSSWPKGTADHGRTWCKRTEVMGLCMSRRSPFKYQR